VTAPARKLLDVAPLISEEMLEAALEESLRRGLTSLARIEWQLRTEGRNGRAGTAVVRKLLSQRDPKLAATESALETKVARWFRSTRLPPPQRQYRVLDGGRFVARLDFAYPEARIAIEVMSFRFHSGRREWLRDENRQRDLKDLDWRIVEITLEDVSVRGTKLETEIAALLGISLF
jgi:very-short-patch-repair endonuclease